MSLRINDSAPDFAAETTQGNVRFHGQPLKRFPARDRSEHLVPPRGEDRLEQPEVRLVIVDHEDADLAGCHHPGARGSR